MERKIDQKALEEMHKKEIYVINDVYLNDIPDIRKRTALKKKDPIKPGNKRRFAVFDILVEENKPVLVGYYDENGYKEFSGKDCIEQFVKFYFDQTEVIDGVYKNMGRYLYKYFSHDNELLIDYLRKTEEYEMKRSPPDETRYKLIDSIRPLKTDIKENWYWRIYDPAEHYLCMMPEEDTGYLDKDIKLLYDIIEKVLTLCNVKFHCNPELTIPKTAMSIFRTKYLKYPINPISRAMTAFIERANYDARAEIFRVEFRPHGKFDKIFFDDFNSYYGWAASGEMPVRQPKKLKAGTYDPKDIEKGFAGAVVTVPHDMYIPPLPVKIGRGTYFPTGKFKGVWDVDELKNAEKHGVIVEWKDAIKFLYYQPILDEYMTDMYALRPEYGQLAKNFITVIIGKFGQRIINIDNIPRHVIPAIRIHSMSIARLSLTNELIARYEEGHEVHRCHTDSVAGTANYPRSGMMGDIKRIYTASRAIFLGTNHVGIWSDNKGFVIKGKNSALQSKTDFVEALKNKQFQFCTRKILEDGNTRPYSYKELLKLVKR